MRSQWSWPISMSGAPSYASVRTPVLKAQKSASSRFTACIGSARLLTTNTFENEKFDAEDLIFKLTFSLQNKTDPSFPTPFKVT